MTTMMPDHQAPITSASWSAWRIFDSRLIRRRDIAPGTLGRCL